MTVTCGVFGARADRRGLAIQTAEMCRHLGPAKVFGIDMKDLSPYYSVWDDYNLTALTVKEHDQYTRDDVKEWLVGLDVVWGAETFYVPWFTGLCREMGVKTVLAVNPEFIGHVLADDWAPLPDRLAPPTRWHLDFLPPGTEPMAHGICRHRLPFRLRTECRTFLHVAGHPALMDRAGTGTVLEALTYVKNPCRVVIRTQKAIRKIGAVNYLPPPGPHIDLQIRIDNPEHYWDLYGEGDVFITPRRYGGQHLPMMEAMSCGMPVLATDCPPQDQILPGEMLVPAYGGESFYSKAGPGIRIEMFDSSAQALAARMDQLIEDEGMVERLSRDADRIASEYSWPALVPAWRRMFEEVCAQ